MWKRLNISVAEYKYALKKIKLNTQEKAALSFILHSPNSTALAEDVAKTINPQKPAVIVANRVIGGIGKKLVQHMHVQLPTYGEKNTPAYFLMIGPYLESEGKIHPENRGWEMQSSLKKALQSREIAAYLELEKPQVSHSTEDEVRQYHDGNSVSVLVNRYERDPRARADFLSNHPMTCDACGFSFEDVYGKIGIGTIEVHHKVPLHTVPGGYDVNPKKDFDGLCSNCHTIIHKRVPALTIQELKELLHRKK